ncbi:rhodanese-like domain-containing protein [Demequina sp. SYSU T00192]|uniref:Rhodanese-like domain-containing protein n=1 Tax=Demequina litoralis TaxID=3051660 RepID=A0ABT8GD97_9MICO|nr:rhodanese-like domain-containing protein [Demequina sp. SYSU T00192]MDN4476644.1 rhodanese-like domain-containing protein [Demequina sp. SYSU T00192]
MNRRIVRGALAGALLALVPAISACSTGADAPAAEVAESVAFDASHVSAAAFAVAAAEEGVTIVDVRTPAEYAEGHLPGAVNIDVSGGDFEAQVSALDPEAEYAVYCRSGSRSRAAIDIMTGAGVEHTVGLEGGIGAWTGDVVTG